MRRFLFSILVFPGLFPASPLWSQVSWVCADSLYQPLPASVHVFKTTDSLDGKPNIAYYLSADLNDRSVLFTSDTTWNRRLTPSAFYEKNSHPLVLVNCTFFSFETNRSLNLVIKNGELVSYNLPSVYNKPEDRYYYITRSAIGIDKNRKADIAWLYTDSSRNYPYALKDGPGWRYGDKKSPGWREVAPHDRKGLFYSRKKKWKMETAVGGGPVLISHGIVHITNEMEKMFTGKAIHDKHPRTAMGYTEDGRLIILVVEGRNPGRAEGATLEQEARLLRDLGCVEALNLDGGGSSCMLVNGKQTITPSDKEGERAVPAVFIINRVK